MTELKAKSESPRQLSEAELRRQRQKTALRANLRRRKEAGVQKGDQQKEAQDE